MPKPIPIFRDHDETLQADACLPLVQAVASGKVVLEALKHGHYPGRKLPNGSLPGLKTVGHWNAADNQDWGLPWHRNEGVELTFVESGTLGFSVDSREYRLQADDLTITRPWQRHRVGSPSVTAGKLHWLILDVGVRRPNQAWKWPKWLMLSRRDLNELTGFLRHNEKPVWRASAEVRRCFQEIGQAVAADRDGSGESRLTVRVNDLFLQLLDLLRKQKMRLDPSLSSSRRTVELFLEDLGKHPEHLELEWTVQDMARQCGLGTTQFVHHVRLLTNMTPMHYLNHCRLDLAAALLREQPQTAVLDIAMACGFSTSQYFATMFGRRFGCSPREFREGRTEETAVQQDGAGAIRERRGSRA